jgi:hypothetical protein
MVFTSDVIKKFQTNYSVVVIVNNCDPIAAKDKSLPTSSYLITCEDNDDKWYDIVYGMRVNIFDAYYDHFGNVLKKMEWTDGTRNPKLWGESSKKKK